VLHPGLALAVAQVEGVGEISNGVVDATPTPSATRQINVGGAAVVGQIDNERRSSRTYATATGETDSRCPKDGNGDLAFVGGPRVRRLLDLVGQAAVHDVVAVRSRVGPAARTRNMHGEGVIGFASW
jgi:hypothetical protein